MTPRKFAANRRNALKSTGPCTPAGKVVSRLNAMKHGLRADEVVVCESYCESESEYEELRREFWRECQPVGPLEEQQVEIMVFASWRMRRAARAESGEIGRNMEVKSRMREQQSEELFFCLMTNASGNLAIRELKKNAHGLTLLDLRLEEIRKAVKREGELSDATLRLSHFNDEPTAWTHQLTELRDAPSEAAGDDAAKKEEKRKKILAFIDAELKYYRRMCGEAMEQERIVGIHNHRANILPPADSLDKILRYSAAAERQYYRAMNQLERLQRMRRGEQLPPPMQLEVSAR